LKEFNIREEDITLKDLENLKEAFVSSTTKNVLPVLKIDGKTIGNGKPGEITRRIYDKICLLKEK
jgi:D-alanine transaminase/branched-chain amino acid aminotransferase